MKYLWKFLTSLRLTVVCLAFGIILIWVGTVAQSDEGLYVAQTRYFKRWFIWGVTLWGKKIPVFLPGGYLLGVVLLVNLVAAHIKRFHWALPKVGIHLTHAGIVLMLLGQLFTDQISRETQMRFTENETRNYSEDAMSYELAFVSDADEKNDKVVVIPASIVERGGGIRHPELPFTIKVKDYWVNSNLSYRAPMAKNAPPLTDKGVAQSFDFVKRDPTHTMDSKNIPTTILEFTATEGSLGTWVAPGWAGDDSIATIVRRSYAEDMKSLEIGAKIASQLTAPQVIEAGGKKYTFSLRPERHYKPFSVTLLKTTWETYPGTKTSSNPLGIPKDFQSRVRIVNPATGDDRQVDIYMNNPLRYAGLTFYQSGMDSNELAANKGLSTLQVVRNPSWLTPYIGCIIVGLGMAWQFLYHLVRFIRKRTSPAPLPA